MTETNTHRQHRMLMKAGRTRAAVLSASLGFAWMVYGITPAIAQMPSENAAEEWTTPQTRLRPVGAPSAVDVYRNDAGSTVSPANRSGFSSDPLAPVQVQAQASTLQSTSVRQAVMMQSASDSSAVPPPSLPSGGFSLPPSGGFAPPASGGFSLPPSGGLPAPNSGGLPAPLTSTPPAGPIMAPPGTFDTTPLPRGGSAINTMPAPPSLPTQPAPTSGAPGTLAPVPRGGTVWPTVSPGFSGSDYAPMTPPQIDSGFATLGNCRNISAPSGYRSDRIQTCGPATGYATPVAATTPVYAPPPAQLGPPVFLPPVPMTQPGMPPVSSQAIIPGSPGYRPLVSFGQERYPVQVGQGIFGQPTAYVPGQKFRNMIRYVTW